jgi:uncharacterized protein YndB with AHSA1/START domain
VGPISLTISIDAPRERVFDFICDLGVRQAWIDHFASEYRLQRIAATGRGAAARFRVDGPAGVRYMETVIAETERPYRIVEHARGGRLDRLPMRIVWELEEGPTTTVSLTFWTIPAGPFDRIREIGREGWWRRRWRRSLGRLRDLVESGEAPARAGLAGGDRIPAMPA